MKKAFQKFNAFAEAAIVAVATLLASCSSKDTTTIVTPTVPVSNPITTTSLKGVIKGTMLTATGTYTITGDITVNKGDTLTVQKGVTVNVTNNATFFVQGVLDIEGTADAPVTFTSTTKKFGDWGGFQCDSAQAVTLKWAKVLYTGGPDATGSSRITLIVGKPINVDIEDSWFLGGQDDCLRMQKGAIFTILRNNIEACGSTDGEAINIKTGANGTVAYNVVWSQAGSGIKVETSSPIVLPQTYVKAYNNTLVGNGFRRGAAEPGRGILVDKFANGEYFNNLIVDDYNGLDINLAADTAKLKYGNNYFFASVDSVRQFFYPAGSFGKKQASDIVSTSKTDKDPKFVKFVTIDPKALTNPNDFHLQTGSPALGAGNTSYNKDIGAYTSDTQGNKH